MVIVKKILFYILLTGVPCSTLYAQNGSLISFDAPKALKGEVNSGAEEGFPLVHPNGLEMYFVRTAFTKNNGGEYAGQDIWKVKINRERTLFKEPTNALGNLNNEENNAVIGFSETGNRIYLLNLYFKKGETKPGISYAEKTSDGWGEPVKMSFPDITLTGNFYAAHIPTTEDVVFISMESGQSKGKSDLFFSTQQNGVWSPLQNLGELNTTGEEMTPFYDSKTSMLFFSSNRNGASADIYYTQKLSADYTAWTEPVKIESQISDEAGFDGYFTVAPDSVCFFVSNRKGGAADIFMTKMHISVPPEPVDTTPVAVISEDTIPDFVPIPVYGNRTANFGFNQTTFTSGGEALLDSVAVYLKKYPEVKISCNGHTCDIGSEKANKTVSKKRAEYVQSELISRGVPKENIGVNWYGYTQPLVPNTSSTNRAKNRRVEILFHYPDGRTQKEIQQM